MSKDYDGDVCDEVCFGWYWVDIGIGGWDW